MLLNREYIRPEFDGFFFEIFIVMIVRGHQVASFGREAVYSSW